MLTPSGAVVQQFPGAAPQASSEITIYALKTQRLRVLVAFAARWNDAKRDGAAAVAVQASGRLELSALVRNLDLTRYLLISPRLCHMLQR